MTDKKNFLDFLPMNFRHEKSFLFQQKLIGHEKISDLTDLEINNILKKSPLCTLHNLKKIRAVAIFQKEIRISTTEAYILLHCGIGSVKALSRLKPNQLSEKIARLERTLRVKTEINITLSNLKNWIERANQKC